MIASSCASFKDDLSSYVDGELGESRLRELTNHLSQCPDCAENHRRLKVLTRFWRQASEMNPSPDLWEHISESLPTVCESIREDLSAYIDGELPPSGQAGVSEHLQKCRQCNGAYTDLRGTHQLLSNELKLPVTTSVELWAEIRARLNEDCALIHSELSAFIDQAVVSDRHRSITRHLIDCPSCHRRFEELARVGEFIGGAYQPSLPKDFDLWPEIKAKLAVVPFQTKSRPRPHRESHKLYLAGMAAVMVGIIGSLVYLFKNPINPSIRPVSAEAYLIDSTLSEPAESAEAVIYENQ